MVVLLHGVAGGWDELAIAVAALAVLWVAVKLAGRKGADDDEDDEEAEEGAERVTDDLPIPSTPGERPDPARSSPSSRG